MANNTNAASSGANTADTGDVFDQWMKKYGEEVGKGMQMFGVGYSTMAAFNQGETQRGVLGYQASVARNNADIAGYQAEIAQQVGAQQEQGSRLRTASLMGTQRADMAASGVDLGQGSANNVLTSTSYMGERDAMTIRQNTAQTVWGLNTQKAGYLAESAADQAASASINPGMSAFGTFISGASMYARNWYNQ